MGWLRSIARSRAHRSWSGKEVLGLCVDFSRLLLPRWLERLVPQGAVSRVMNPSTVAADMVSLLAERRSGGLPALL